MENVIPKYIIGRQAHRLGDNHLEWGGPRENREKILRAETALPPKLLLFFCDKL